MPSPLELTIILQLIDNATKNFLKVKESIDKVNDSTKKIESTNFSNIQNSTQKLQDKFQNLQHIIKQTFDPKTLDEFSEKLEDFALKKAVIATSTLAGLKSTVSAFTNLEQAQTDMEIAFMEKGGKISKELEEVKKLANELGTKLPGSTEDFYRLAQALGEQGLSIRTIKNGALEASAYLGALFKVNYNEAGEMVAKFQEAFGVADKDLVKFIDLMQKYKFAFGQNLMDIKYAVQYIGPALQTLGISGLENAKKTLAWMGILSGMSIEASMAGTAIQTALENTLKFEEIKTATKGDLADIRKLFEEKGIQIKLFDEKGTFLGIENFFNQITQLSKLNQKEMMFVVNKIFGDVGARAILPLLLKTKKTFEEQKEYLDFLLQQNIIDQNKYQTLLQQAKEGTLNTAIEESIQKMEKQASLQERISKQLSTTKATWEAFSGTLYTLTAQIGSLFAPLLNKALDFLNNRVIGPLSDFIEQNQTLAKIMIYPIAGLGSLAIALSSVALAGGLALKYFSFLIETLTPLKFAFTMLINILKIVIASFRLLNLTLLTNPIFLIGAAFVVVALLIYKFWKPISNFFKGLWQGIKEGLKPLIPAIKEIAVAFTPFKSIINFMMNLIVKLGKTIWNLIKPIDDTGNAAYSMGIKFGKIIWNIISLILKIPLTLLSLPSKMFEAGQKIVDSIIGGIKSKIGELAKTMKDVAQKVRNHLPFSPAKEGPLKDIHLTGGKLIATISQGIKEDPLISRVSAILNKAKNLLNLSPIGLITKNIMNTVPPESKSIPLTNKTPTKNSTSINITVHPVININGTIPDKKTAELLAYKSAEQISKAIDKVIQEKMRLNYGL